MKTINSRKVVVFGAILVVTLAAGCFGGGRGYSNQPYGYNSGYYNSNPYGGGYENPNPYNSGYNGGHSYPQSYGNSDSHSAEHEDRERAEASRGDHQDRATDQHVAATRDQGQARTEKQPPSADHDEHSRKDSESGHASERN